MEVWVVWLFQWTLVRAGLELRVCNQNNFPTYTVIVLLSTKNICLQIMTKKLFKIVR